MKIIEITKPKSLPGDCKIVASIDDLINDLKPLFHAEKGEIVQLRVKEMSEQEYLNLINLHEWYDKED